MVARIQLHQMRQDRDDHVRMYAAGVCNFKQKYTCNFRETMIRKTLICGPEDIRRSVWMSLGNQNRT